MKKNSFIEGTIIATVAIVLTKILGMVYVIPFYAMVGIQGAALYSYAYNIYNIFLDISSAGIPIAISKLVSEYNTLGEYDAKRRVLKIGRKIVGFISVVAFIILFVFANQIGGAILGDLSQANTVEDVAFAIRCVSFSILVIPFLSVAKGYLQGHKFIALASFSQIIEQVVRIVIILAGSFLALYVFDLNLTTAVGIAVFGAFVGGISALLYLQKKIHDNKTKLHLEVKEKSNISNKEIFKKIVSYAIPFIVINTAVSIYTFINLILINRGLNVLGYSDIDVEFITTSIATWTPKINSIIGALAMGMSVSLIPSIVEAFTLKKFDLVQARLNKALQIILLVSIPMTIGISLLSSSVWSVFYGNNSYGALILAVNIFTALFLNLYMITSSTLQSLNKFKTVYLSTILGFFINAILDIPLMFFFNSIGLEPFIGAVIATIIGYSISITIALKSIKTDFKVSYHSTVKVLGKILLPTLLMVGVVIILKFIIPVNLDSKLMSILYIAIISFIGGLVYLITAYKMKLLHQVFGSERLANIIKKLTFGKVRIKV